MLAELLVVRFGALVEQPNGILGEVPDGLDGDVGNLHVTLLSQLCVRLWGRCDLECGDRRCPSRRFVRRAVGHHSPFLSWEKRPPVKSAAFRPGEATIRVKSHRTSSSLIVWYLANTRKT